MAIFQAIPEIRETQRLVVSVLMQILFDPGEGQFQRWRVCICRAT